MPCPTCGAAAPEDAGSCPECGAAMAIVCPACGAHNPPTARFCAQCGTGLKESAAPQPTTAPARRPAPDAEHRQVTVLFCDLVGFTELSGRLEPDELRRVVRLYQERCAEVVGRFEGHVAKFLGDGMLAFFGYPQAHEDDAERAVRAGLELVEGLGRLEPAEGVRLRARVGISTGPVVVADLAATGREILGEPPNRAARLQAIAEPDSVVIGPRTLELLGQLFECADLGEHRFKGFDEPVRVWRVLGPGRAAGRFAALHSASLTPLVGREHELGLVLDRWQQARGGEGQVLLLTGEPGIGKSRLVQALCDAVANRTHALVHYQCLPYWQNSALQPAIEELERAAGILREDEAEVRFDKLEAHLARVGVTDRQAAQILADLLLIPTAESAAGTEANPQQLKARRLDALIARLDALAARTPVLLVAEDVHWIDPSSRELLERIIERSPEMPVLVVVTARPEGVLPRVTHANATALALNRLSRRQAALLVQQTGGKPMPPEVVEQIAAKAEGVPLYLEELTRAVLESGSFADRGDRFELRTGSLPPVAIPASLRDSLAARLDRLGALRELVQTAAVIGRTFSYELIAAVTQSPESELAPALRQLVETGLMFGRGEPPDATYSFKHALLQDAAYQALVREQRQEVHARVARVLASDFPEIMATHPELIAHHCTEAGLDEEAVEFWRDAGELALARGSPREAVADLENALRLLSRFPESAPRNRTELGLQTSLGSALIAARGFAAPETGAAYARAWALCQQTGEQARRLPVLYGRWIFQIARAEVKEALEVADDMVRHAEQRGDPTDLLVAHRALANTWFFLGDLPRAQAHAEEVTTRYDPAQHRRLANEYSVDPFVVCCFFLGHTLVRRGRPDRALGVVAKGRARAQELGHVVTLAHAFHHGCLFHQLRRETPAVLQHADELSALAARHGLPFWAALAQIFRGWAVLESGRTAEGASLLRDGIAAYRATSGRLYLPYALALWADACRRLDEVEDGLRAVAEARALVEETGVHGFETYLHRVEGELLLARAQPDPAAAQARFEQAMAVAHRQDAKLSELRAAVALARLWRERGEDEEGFELLEPLYGAFTEGLDLPDLRDAQALLDELRHSIL